ncbi:hypothetical protein UCRPA7_8721 [Phaeoacremonium minimum UCRPA7]|uniref:Uncharacterized protein n=1 Tax=Phaeoacremonium minimum (strain UCR-PA7) TaxID=1286976 RepID=R8B922_PHAM7|nr:hypothetical protein UCRPA7_8721 [Phaeoacremonium minimum UCRPA7]EON95792.1 hypothetical protein UCRPA7_8721 [Phaeoacremonium minimum UCRPA7]
MVSTWAFTVLSIGLFYTGCEASRLIRPISARQSNSTSGSNSTSSGGDLPDYLSPPNATGSYAITGFDLSQPYDAAKSNEKGWSLDIAVATNRVVDDVTNNETRGNPTYLSLKSPENAFESADFDSGWTICGNFWDIDDNDLQASFLEDNGTCTSVLSDECIADIEQKAVNFTNDGTCPSHIEIDTKKCPDFGISNAVSRFTGSVAGDLEDSLNNQTSAAGSVMLYSVLFPYSHPANTTETSAVYDEVMQKTWPSVVTFYYDDGNGVKAFPTVRCLRAKDLAAGSQQPTPLEGAAAVPGVSAALVMAAGVAAVFIVWM